MIFVLFNIKIITLTFPIMSNEDIQTILNRLAVIETNINIILKHLNITKIQNEKEQLEQKEVTSFEKSISNNELPTNFNLYSLSRENLIAYIELYKEQNGCCIASKFKNYTLKELQHIVKQMKTNIFY